MSPRFDRRSRDQGQGSGDGGARSGGRPPGRSGPRTGSRPFTPRGEWRGEGGERSSRPERPARRSFDGPRSEGYRKEGYRKEGFRSDAPRSEGHRTEGYRAEGYRSEGSRSEGARGAAAGRPERRFDRRPGSSAQGEGRSFRQGRPQGRPAFKPRPGLGERRFDRSGPRDRDDDRFRGRDRDRDRPLVVELPAGEAERFSAGPADDLIWGRHAAQAALEAGRPIHRIWCTPEMRFQPRFLQLLREAKAGGVLVEEVTWARLGQLTDGAVHQGIVLQAAAADTLDLGSLIEGCRDLGEPPLLMALDGITDPHNLGAIVRSAEALGAHGLVLPQRRSAGLTGSVAKVAAGALEHLPVARVVNLNRALDSLKQEGYRVVGLAGEGDVCLSEADLDGPLVIVTGSEGAGLSMLTRKHCDQLVRIPLRGTTPSLNASVATAMVLYEVARRGWMKQISGAAPAPRIVRPQMPAPPALATAASELAAAREEPQLDAHAQPDDAAELDALFSPEQEAAAEQLVADVVAELSAPHAEPTPHSARPAVDDGTEHPLASDPELSLDGDLQRPAGFSADIQL